MMALQNIPIVVGGDFNVGLNAADANAAQLTHLRQGLWAWGPHNFTVIIFIHMKYNKNEDSSYTH